MADTTQITYLAIVTFILLWLMYSLHRIKVYRFYRPTCGHCIKSQDEWDRFRRMCTFRKIKIIDVNLNDGRTESMSLAKKMGVVSVPHVVAVHNDGTRRVYDGKRSASDYLEWVNAR